MSIKFCGLFFVAWVVMCVLLDYFEIPRNWSACAGAIVASPLNARLFR